MKKLLLLLVLAGLVSQPCLAGQGRPPLKGAPDADAMNNAAAPLSIQGVVEKVVHADPPQGIRPKITIIALNGVRYIFDVHHTTTIYDRDWKSTTLEQLQRGQQIKVRYTISKEGFKEALSIITIR